MLPSQQQSPQKQKPKTSQLSYSARAHAQKGELCCSALLPSPSPTPPIPVKKKEKRKKKRRKGPLGSGRLGAAGRVEPASEERGNKSTNSRAGTGSPSQSSLRSAVARHRNSGIGGKKNKEKKRNRRSISPEIKPSHLFSTSFRLFPEGD